jgi:protein-tyrosine-phosphatase/DNA-binding transcriptional ArsR family regulator
MGIFRLLMRRCPDQLSAGEIAAALDLKPSTASVYLSALKQAGLISQRRDGTHLFYAVNLNATQEVVSGLVMDCCRGRADLCPPSFASLLSAPTPRPGGKLNVLFVCTGNSARSVFAETLMRDLAGDRFNAYSAGTAPASRLNPNAVELLRSKGHDTSALRSKNLAEFQGDDAPKMDFVFTVCDRAANEACPTWPGHPVSGHWGVPDPVKATGTRAEQQLAFQQAYGALRNRIGAFTSLSFAQLGPGSLQRQIDEIGRAPLTQDR